MSYASASVLVTFDASSCEASLNSNENINTYEKSKMPRGIERKIKSILCPHDRIGIGSERSEESIFEYDTKEIPRSSE